MSREPEKTEIITAAERRAYIRRIEMVIKDLKDIDDVVGNDDCWVFRKPSLNDGLRRIEAFTADLRRTINQIIGGKPLGKKSTKFDLTN